MTTVSTGTDAGRHGRTAAWICLACAAALLFVEHWRTISDPAVWTRLAAGQAVAGGGLASTNTLSFAVPDSSRATAGWLYNRLLFALYSAGGAPLTTTVHLLVFGLALALAVRLSRRQAGWLSTGFVVVTGLFATRACQLSSPSTPALLLALAAASLLQRHRLGLAQAILLGCLQVFWANSAPGALLLPALAAASLWQSGPGRKEDRIVRLRLAVALLLLPILNPAGPGWYAMEAGFWLSPSAWTDRVVPPLLQHLVPAPRIDLLLTALLLAGLAGMLARKDRLPPVETTLGLAAALMATRHGAHAVFLAVWALPFLAMSFDAIAARLRGRLPATAAARTAAILAWTIPIAATALAAVTALDFTSGRWYRRHGWTSRFGAGLDTAACPAGAVTVLKTEEFPERVWNLPRDGGFLAFSNPSRRIFCDTRTSLYGGPFIQSMADYLAHDPASVEAYEKKWNIQAVLLNALEPGACEKARRMLETPAWTLGYWDGLSILLLKPRPYGRQEDRVPAAVRADGLRRIEDEANRWSDLSAEEAARLPFPARLAGAADFLFLSNRHAEARRLYGILLRHFPELAGLRYMHGHCLATDGRTQEAVREWERLVRELPRHRGGWLALQAAYKTLGRTREAGEAADRARKLAPGT